MNIDLRPLKRNTPTTAAWFVGEERLEISKNTVWNRLWFQ